MVDILCFEDERDRADDGARYWARMIDLFMAHDWPMDLRHAYRMRDRYIAERDNYQRRIDLRDKPMEEEK